MKSLQLHFIGTSLFILLSCLTLFAEPMSTGFTYQGRLLENGQPGTGTYDLQCKLFDAKTEGTQIGETLIFEDGSSSDGYFTLGIDFGVEVFNGEARYLEMAFRPWDSTNPSDFVVLADRVELTPTPYSLQTRGIYVDPNMLVGIGTTDLSDAQLKIETTQKHGLYVKSQVTEGPQWGIYSYVDGTTTDDSYAVRGGSGNPFGNNTGLWGWARQPSSGDNIGVYGVASNDGAGDAFAGYFSLAKSYFGENVGIGTMNPTEKLDVDGTVKATAFVGDGSGLTNLPSLSSIWTLNGSDIYYNSGRVGVGTVTPTAKMEVYTDEYLHGIKVTTGNIPINAYRNGTSGSWPAVHGENDSPGNSTSGVRGILNSTNSGVDAAGVYGLNNGTDGDGCGVRGLHNGTGAGVYGRCDNSGGKGIYGHSDNGFAGYFTGAKSYFQNNVGIGTTNPSALLEVAGLAKVEILQITGADVAEKFPVSEPVEPGMLVAIDSENPGKLCLCRGQYNRKIAGVVSGAKDFPAGAILGNLPGHEDSIPVALTGRVWVYCVAQKSAIKPGDMLTSSKRPGYAMPVSDYTQAHGAVLGKAMTTLEQGQAGLVLALINLQ
jgi:hypothetical protein